MTRDELETLLAGRDLHEALDIRTLILDSLRKSPNAHLEQLFWQLLPELKLEQLAGYQYMQRQ